MTPRETLIDKAATFLGTIVDKTPGAETERWLNAVHGPGTAIYEDLARLIRKGVADGWAAETEIAGPHYRRSQLLAPSEKTYFFSLTTVFMDSQAERVTSGDTPDRTDVLRGDYHLHPYGEFNLVVPLDAQAELKGPLGWRHAGWTAPAPGSHHYPEVRGGALIALFFLPSGRISYDIAPPRRAHRT